MQIPKFYLVASNVRFRKLARDLVTPSDTVLEIGCSTGEATRIAASRALRVVATDRSQSIIDKAKQLLVSLSNVEFKCIDARHTQAFAEVAEDATVLMIDIGGDAHPSRIVAVAFEIAATLKKVHTVLLRNIALTCMHKNPWVVETTSAKDGYAHFKPHSVLEDFHRFAMSSDKSDRIFAATLIPQVQNLSEQEEKEFNAAVAKLQNDASFKVRHFSRKAQHLHAIEASNALR